MSGGLTDGPRALIAAARRVLTGPVYWPFLTVPTVVFALLSALAIGASLSLARPALEAALGGSSGGVDWLDRLIVWAATLGGAAFGILLSALVAAPLSAPALERLVALTEADLGLAPRAALGFWAEMGCGLRAQAAALLLTAPLWLVLLLLDLALPILLPFTSGLRALLAAFGIAWMLIDYPLTLRGIGPRKRWFLFRRAPGSILGFGATFALLFWLPCCGLLLIGVGVVAATELVARLATKDPEWSAALAARRNGNG